MTQPVRLTLSRAKGFNLQALSLATNGLPARAVTRPGLFGNIFQVNETTSQEQAVKSFGQFLKRWSGTRIMRASRDEDGAPNPAGGVGLIMYRNHIRARLWQLRGHNLACFCKRDQPCHVDIYLGLMATDMPERWKARYPGICEEVKR